MGRNSDAAPALMDKTVPKGVFKGSDPLRYISIIITFYFQFKTDGVAVTAFAILSRHRHRLFVTKNT
jgi:hypothetical protein